MKNWILALGALSVVGSACNPVVLDPLKATPGAVIPGDTTTSGGGNGGRVVLAMRSGDINWQDPDDFHPDGVPWSNPDSLVLFFGTDAQECSNPVLVHRCLGSGPFWQEVFILPPELAHPGLINLIDPRIAQYSNAFWPNGTTMCGSKGYWGKGRSGTLELISDGLTTLSAKLAGVEGVGSGAVIDGVDQGPLFIDGTYTGDLCGAPPPFAPATPALAIRGMDLPAGPGGMVTPEPDSLVVFLGTLPDTCQDPWAAADCTSAARLSFTLPAALQKPGVLTLSDPALGATYTDAATSGSSTCAQSSWKPTNSTVEILTSDAGGLTFKVYNASLNGTASGGWLAFDGLYSAPICP